METEPSMAETLPAETLSVETVPAETEAAQTLPEQTEVSEETVPTTQAPTEETLPPETEPTLPPETEPALPPETVPEPMSTLPAETIPEEPERIPVISISQARSLPAGTAGVCLEGTVVYAQDTLAILQDETGSIRLRFDSDPGTYPGEQLLVTGSCGADCLMAEDFTVLGTGELPWVPGTLLDAPDALRVCIRGAVLGESTLTQQGFTLEVEADSTLPAGSRVDAWGVLLNGIFYADRLQRSEVPEASETPPDSRKLYFGQLHAHSDVQTPGGTPAEIFSAAAALGDLDFFAITDHSDSLDNASFGSVGIDGSSISTAWASGKAAAAAVTSEDFVGIYSYEMSWPESALLGHISTFGTPGWQSHTQPGFETLESYGSALAAVPESVSQINHPSLFYGNFQMLSGCTPQLDQVLHLLELGDFGDPAPIDYYSKALDKGWHLAPARNPGKEAGITAWEQPVRTVVLADALTETALYEAIRSYRVYATEDPDLSIRYQLNGAELGSILGPQENLTVSLSVSDPTDGALGLAEVVADGGRTIASQSLEGIGQLTLSVPTGYTYYYIRFTQPDGNTAVTAPVWVDSYEDMGIRSFTASQTDPVQEREVTAALELYNQEAVPFLLESLEFYEGETLLSRTERPGTVHPMQSLTYRFPYTRQEPGTVTLRVVVTGTAEGHRRSYELSLILRFQPKQLAVSTIAQVRGSLPGQAFRISGYLTSGSSNLYNTFRDTLYLQDDTGGIALTGSIPQRMEVGTPLEATGVLRRSGGNLVLELTDYTLPGGTYYRHVPATMSHKTAMDYASHGGELLQIEGTVVSLTKTADGKGISRLTLKDIRGDLASVIIEDNIRSASYGINDLASRVKKGRTVRVMGLLHMDEFEKPVLRVRNCEEVVYVPAVPDFSNPRTGDILAWLVNRLFPRH